MKRARVQPSTRPSARLAKRRRVAAAAPPLTASTLLNLMWLASPALPVGGFSYSEVLEAAIESGRVHDEASCARWLSDQLQLSLARSELAVASRAFKAWQRNDGADVQALNDWVIHTRESREMRLQTEQMGRSLAVWLQQQAPEDPRVGLLSRLRPAPTWPVAFALASERTGAPLKEALLSMAFGWAENMVQAALKAVPLGQVAGQRVLATVTAAIPAAVTHAIALPGPQRQAMAPMLAILSAQHETQYSRLFRS